MKDFLEAIKKLLKIILIIVLIVVAIGALVGGYTYYSDKVEYTIDEEIGLMCQSAEYEDKFIRMILASSPKSRATNNYYDRGYMINYNHSEINETSEGNLLPMNIDKRTVDYVYVSDLFDGFNFKLNRKTLELAIIEKSDVDTNDHTVIQVNQCEEVDPQVIRDKVTEINAESSKSNKL